MRCKFHCILIGFALFLRLNGLISLKSELGCADRRKCIAQSIITVPVDHDGDKRTDSLRLLDEVQRCVVINIRRLDLIVLYIIRKVVKDRRAVINQIPFTTENAFDRRFACILALLVYSFGSLENMRECLNNAVVSDRNGTVSERSSKLNKISRLGCRITLAHLGMDMKLYSLPLSIVLSLGRLIGTEET